MVGCESARLSLRGARDFTKALPAGGNQEESHPRLILAETRALITGLKPRAIQVHSERAIARLVWLERLFSHAGAAGNEHASAATLRQRRKAPGSWRFLLRRNSQHCGARKPGQGAG